MGYKKYEVYKFVGDEAILGTVSFNDIVVRYEFSGFMYKEYNKNKTFLGVQVGLPDSGEELEVTVKNVEIDSKSVNFEDVEDELIELFYGAIYDIDINGKIILNENKSIKEALDVIYFDFKEREWNM